MLFCPILPAKSSGPLVVNVYWSSPPSLETFGRDPAGLLRSPATQNRENTKKYKIPHPGLAKKNEQIQQCPKNSRFLFLGGKPGVRDSVF